MLHFVTWKTGRDWAVLRINAELPTSEQCCNPSPARKGCIMRQLRLIQRHPAWVTQQQQTHLARNSLKSPHHSFRKFKPLSAKWLSLFQNEKPCRKLPEISSPEHPLTRHPAAFCDRNNLTLSRTCFVCDIRTTEAFLACHKKEAGLTDICIHVRLSATWQSLQKLTKFSSLNFTHGQNYSNMQIFRYYL